jgi:Family of unknown function (DUF6328)
MTTALDPPATSNDEQSRERYRELLEELRTVIPGVQVLFAFLLTVPFSARFQDLDDVGRDLYAVAVVAVALAAVLFITPTAYHRLNNDGDRERRVRIGVRCAIAGMAMLATAIVVSLFVVVRFVFDDTALAALLAGTIAVAVLWVGVALAHRGEAPGAVRVTGGRD